jgi:hypothetical protein
MKENIVTVGDLVKIIFPDLSSRIFTDGVRNSLKIMIHSASISTWMFCSIVFTRQIMIKNMIEGGKENEI